MAVNDGGVPPILAQKHYAQPSEFTPENLLREAQAKAHCWLKHPGDLCPGP